MTENRRFEIRGETRLKNAKLVRAREEVGMSQKKFAEHVGIPYVSLNAYENLREYPITKHRKILSSYCNCSEEELFPQELRQYAEGEEQRKLIQIAEVEPSRLLGSVRREALLVASTSNPDSELEEAEMRSYIRNCLAILPTTQAKVLILYFGLDGEDSKTLEEIGVILNLGRERVRQLKLLALSRLSEGDIGRVLASELSVIEGAVDPAVDRAHDLVTSRRNGIPSSRADRISSETILIEELRKKVHR